MVLLVAVRTRTRRLSHQDRLRLTPEIRHIRHRGGKCPPPRNHEQPSGSVQLRQKDDLRYEILASLHVVPADIPTHIDDQTFWRMLRYEVPERLGLLLKVFV